MRKFRVKRHRTLRNIKDYKKGFWHDDMLWNHQNVNGEPSGCVESLSQWISSERWIIVTEIFFVHHLDWWTQKKQGNFNDFHMEKSRDLKIEGKPFSVSQCGIGGARERELCSRIPWFNGIRRWIYRFLLFSPRSNQLSPESVVENTFFIKWNFTPRARSTNRKKKRKNRCVSNRPAICLLCTCV